MSKIKYALYGRVSSAKQRDDATIEMQKNSLHDFVQRNNLDVYDEYYDEAQSGTLPFADRPEGRRLLADAKAGHFNTVLFYRTDRLGRSAFEGLKVCMEFDKLNVSIRSITEPYDTSTATGKYIFTQMLSVAEMELSTIKTRMNDGKQRNLRNGKLSVAGRAPYGYVFGKDGSLQIDNSIAIDSMTKADVVRMIFEKTAYENYGTVQLSNYMNSIGIPATTGILRYWSPSKILHILNNPKYYGQAIYNRRSRYYDEFVVSNPAIVSKELWETAAQQRIARKLYNRQGRNPHHYLLNRGLLRCSHCGYAYSGIYYKRQKLRTHRYYKCTGRSRIDYNTSATAKHCTVARPIPADWIEEIVWDECLKVLTHKTMLNKIIKAYYSDTLSPVHSGPKKEDIEKRIKNIKKERQTLIDLRLKNIISDEDLHIKLEELDSALKKAQKLLAELKAPVVDPAAEIKNLRHNIKILQAALKNINDFEVKYSIVHAMLDSVFIFTTADYGVIIDINLNLGADGLCSPLDKTNEANKSVNKAMPNMSKSFSTRCN